MSDCPMCADGLTHVGSTCPRERRKTEGRCVRCGNWPEICGHDLSLSEKAKTIAIDKSSLR